MVELFILQILLVYALPSAGALSTVSAPFGVVNVKAPEPTAPPKDWNQILRKDNVLLGGGGTIDVDDRVCGWVDADPGISSSCLKSSSNKFRECIQLHRRARDMLLGHRQEARRVWKSEVHAICNILY